MHLFGRSKKKEAAAESEKPHNAIAELKEKKSMLEKRKEVMEHKANQEKAKALELMKTKTEKNKKAAVLHMKRKKMYESNVDDLEAMAMNMDVQILQIEKMKINVEAFNAQKAGTDAMKAIQKDFTAEKVDDMAMELQEQMDVAADINSALTAPFAGQDVMDDDELLAELEDLEQEEANEIMGEIPATELNAVEAFEFPSAPVGAPHIVAPAPAAQAAETEEEREMRLLEESMA